MNGTDGSAIAAAERIKGVALDHGMSGRRFGSGQGRGFGGRRLGGSGRRLGGCGFWRNFGDQGWNTFHGGLLP